MESRRGGAPDEPSGVLSLGPHDEHLEFGIEWRDPSQIDRLAADAKRAYFAGKKKKKAEAERRLLQRYAPESAERLFRPRPPDMPASLWALYRNLAPPPQASSPADSAATNDGTQQDEALSTSQPRPQSAKSTNPILQRMQRLSRSNYDGFPNGGMEQVPTTPSVKTYDEAMSIPLEATLQATDADSQPPATTTLQQAGDVASSSTASAADPSVSLELDHLSLNDKTFVSNEMTPQDAVIFGEINQAANLKKDDRQTGTDQDGPLQNREAFLRGSMTTQASDEEPTDLHTMDDLSELPSHDPNSLRSLIQYAADDQVVADSTTRSTQSEETAGTQVNTSVSKTSPTAIRRPTLQRGLRFYTGIASTYGTTDGFAKKITATGEVMDPSAMTAAIVLILNAHGHLTLPLIPLGTYVTVTNLTNNVSVKVLIEDDGPLEPGRIIDLSPAAMRFLNNGVADGLISVRVVPCQS